MRIYFRTYCILLIIFSCNPKKSFDEIDNQLIEYDQKYGDSIESVSENYLKSIVQESKEKDYVRGMYNSYRRIGIIYLKLGDYQIATQELLKSIELSENEMDSFATLSSYNILGNIHFRQKRFNEAKSIYLKAFDFAKRKKSKYFISDITLNLAAIYISLNKIDSALHLANISITEKLKLDKEYQYDIAFNYQQIAEIALLKGNFDSSKYYFSLAYSSFNRNGLIDQTIYPIKGKAILYDKLNNKDSSNYYRSLLITKFKLLDDKDVKFEICGDAVELFEKVGDFASVIYFYKSKDSIQRKNNLNYFDFLTTKFNYKKKEDENFKLKSKNTTILGITFFTIIAFLFTLVTYILYRRTSKKKMELKSLEINKLIQSQELSLIDATLTGQDKERQRIAQELHDGIGSNLARAKMHFSIIEEEINRINELNKEKYSEMSNLLEDTLKDVRRISHDMYGNTVLTLGLVIAVQQLIDAIEKIYPIKIVLQEINIPKLDFDTEISIYRIVQELLSNTLKHSKAKTVNIQFIGHPNNIHLAYEDDGIGFDQSIIKEKSGIGLFSMVGRIASLHGTHTIESSIGNGFTFFADIPYSNI